MSGTRTLLIWGRELRDLVRDRRTMLLLFGLPVLLYPGFGLLGFLFALSIMDQVTLVGVTRPDQLRGRDEPAAVAAWLSLTPRPDGSPAQSIGPAMMASTAQGWTSLPPLIVGEGLNPDFASPSWEPGIVQLVDLPGDPAAALAAKDVDVVLDVPADFASALQQGRRPKLTILSREADDTSKLAHRRLQAVLTRWLSEVKQARFRRLGLPGDFDQPVEIRDPAEDKPPEKKIGDEIRDSLVRVFPFVVIMWALAGALQPAIDMAAGEKERGTMETLLISPASRTEIVAGKFLAVTVFSAVTAWWNLIWFGGGAVALSWFLPSLELLRPVGLIWCALFTPLFAALFSAVSLALGVYARSTKEGQYYLIPLFMVTIPLIFLSLAPGTKLTPTYSLVPLTGAALLLQKMMTPAGEPIAWGYFLAVPGGLALWVGLALTWAVAQFHREDVLFREAEAADPSLWIRSLFRKRSDVS